MSKAKKQTVVKETMETVIEHLNDAGKEFIINAVEASLNRMSESIKKRMPKDLLKEMEIEAAKEALPEWYNIGIAKRADLLYGQYGKGKGDGLGKHLTYLQMIIESKTAVKSGKDLTAIDGKTSSDCWNIYRGIVIGMLAVKNKEIDLEEINFLGVDKPAITIVPTPEKATVIRRPKK